MSGEEILRVLKDMADELETYGEIQTGDDTERLEALRKAISFLSEYYEG